MLVEYLVSCSVWLTRCVLWSQVVMLRQVGLVPVLRSLPTLCPRSVLIQECQRAQNRLCRVRSVRVMMLSVFPAFFSFFIPDWLVVPLSLQPPPLLPVLLLPVPQPLHLHLQLSSWPTALDWSPPPP